MSRKQASTTASGLSLNFPFSKILIIAVAYVIVGRLGQEIVVQRVTPVWPASGLALATLLIGGYRMWPAITLGSFLVNSLWGFDTHRAASSAMAIGGIAAGATLEALTGAYLLRKYSSDVRSLHRSTDVFKFLLLGGVTSPVIAASFGTSSLSLFHFLPWQDYGVTWLTWWTGDMAGILIVTPLILALTNKEETAWDAKRLFEAGILFLMILIVEKITFQTNYPLQYMFIPCVVWAAFRFGERGATSVVLLILAIAVWETIHGVGPFIRTTLNESLLMLQVFMVVMVMTSLILTSVLYERLRRNQELTDARIQAEEASRAKSVFLTTMSHELRTPLNHILGYAELLEESAIEEGRNDSLADLKKIKSSGKHLLALIQRILDFTNLEAGKMNLQLEEFDLQELVQEIESEVRPIADKNQNQFQISVLPVEISMKSDRAKVRQILLNVLDNACKFTKKGEVHLRISSERNQTIFRVSDTGIGMTPSEQLHIFDAFKQADGSTARKFEGAGLGLAITHRLCVALDGEITVSSIPQQGSTFTIRLPQVPHA